MGLNLATVLAAEGVTVNIVRTRKTPKRLSKYMTQNRQVLLTTEGVTGYDHIDGNDSNPQGPVC
jgi:hypothetical protein